MKRHLAPSRKPTRGLAMSTVTQVGDHRIFEFSKRAFPLCNLADVGAAEAAHAERNGRAQAYCGRGRSLKPKLAMQVSNFEKIPAQQVACSAVNAR